MMANIKRNHGIDWDMDRSDTRYGNYESADGRVSIQSEADGFASSRRYNVYVDGAHIGIFRTVREAKVAARAMLTA
jgi:NADH:ubiquinone oxidoreductase subunit D